MSKLRTQYLTCKFKLHNPSVHKQAVIDYALFEYTQAYQRLLEYAKENTAFIAEHGKYIPKSGKPRYTTKSIGKLLPRSDALMHSSLADSLNQDVAAGLASYYELVQVNTRTSFPTCRDPLPDADDDALDNFILVGSSQTDYDQSRNRYLKNLRGSVMPLYFCRADGASQTQAGAARNRNFSLLVNSAKQQLLAALWLLPNGHELCKPLGAQAADLARIDTGEVFTSNSKTAILVPLQVGRNGWQEHKFLEEAKRGRARVKSAYLIRDDNLGEYFLHISFEFPCPVPYVPETHLGIDKGILVTAAYGLIDSEGRILEMGHLIDDLRSLQQQHGHIREYLSKKGQKVTKTHYKRQAYDNILHGLANTLIDLAIEHKAQVVVEDLSIQVRGGRVVSRFRKLDKILAYKCKLAGVPFRSVFAAWSSTICPMCGELMDRDDRFVSCPHCGYSGHSDDSAAINIARRAFYKKADWENHFAFHRSFANLSTL